MNVKLLNSSDSIDEMEYNAAYGALTCHTNQHKDFTPSDVLKRIIKAGHESVLEHITLTFEVNDLSRACLQELARHRHTSLSVESTRHTLKKNMKYGDIVLTVNVREMRHILKQRISPDALKEFQVLAHKLFDAVPNDYTYLLEDCLYKEDN